MDNRTFLPVKSDIIFRIFFGDEKNIEFLIGFLKSVLRLPDDDYDEIEILDPHLLREFPGDKLGIIDIKLKTRSRKIVHIEIQLSVTPELKNRIIFYDAKLITEQIGSSDDFYSIKKVISIVITDEKLIPASPKYLHRFTFYDQEAKVELSDLIEIFTLELGKLPESTDGTILYDWASFIAAESEEELMMIAERNPQVGKAVVKFRELSADERTRDIYERRQIAEWDMMARERWAIKQSKFEIARNALLMNMSIGDIIRLTGLTADEIENLRIEL